MRYVIIALTLALSGCQLMGDPNFNIDARNSNFCNKNCDQHQNHAESEKEPAKTQVKAEDIKIPVNSAPIIDDTYEPKGTLSVSDIQAHFESIDATDHFKVFNEWSKGFDYTSIKKHEYIGRPTGEHVFEGNIYVGFWNQNPGFDRKGEFKLHADFDKGFGEFVDPVNDDTYIDGSVEFEMSKGHLFGDDLKLSRFRHHKDHVPIVMYGRVNTDSAGNNVEVQGLFHTNELDFPRGTPGRFIGYIRTN